MERIRCRNPRQPLDAPSPDHRRRRPSIEEKNGPLPPTRAMVASGKSRVLVHPRLRIARDRHRRLVAAVAPAFAPEPAAVRVVPVLGKAKSSKHDGRASGPGGAEIKPHPRSL